MKKAFRNIDDVFRSSIRLTAHELSAKEPTSRVLRSTKLEDRIYMDLRGGDTSMDELEDACAKKLPTFSALARDVYQSLYSLNVRFNPDDELSEAAKRFNKRILEDAMGSDEYPTIKSICEGRQLPAYDAATEFVENISNGLDQLLNEAGGEKGKLPTLEKLETQRQALADKLIGLMEQREEGNPDPALDRRIIDLANQAASKMGQAESVSAQIRDNLIKNRDAVREIVIGAIGNAACKAEETFVMQSAWGIGDDSGGPRQSDIDKELIGRIRKSRTLIEVSRHLGRFKEIMSNARKNGYAYGRGEKYGLELGNNLQRTLTSEFLMLAVPESMPLFLRKYQQKRLKQYKRREKVSKGLGDIICVLDESDSTAYDAPWGKAVAFALLDIAMAGNRKFALIHFSGKGKYRTDLFAPGAYGISDVLAAAETFLTGGTDYETPLKEALRLINQEGFENADIVFITDGACDISEGLQKSLEERQCQDKFKITGILLDETSPGFAFSLDKFCADVYRVSELARDGLIDTLLSSKVS